MNFLAILLYFILHPAQGPAAARTLSGSVEAADGTPVKHAVVRIANVGEDVTSDTGQFAIRLPAGVESGYPLVFSVSGWVVTDPYSGARGKMYLPKDKMDIPIKVAKSGSDSLISERQIKHMVEEIVSQLQPKTTSSAPASVSVAEKAKEIGVQPERLQSAIDVWKSTASTPYDRGLAALQEEKYAEASRLIQQSMSGSESNTVEKYISLGNAEYYQGHYAAAAAALLKACDIAPNNSNALNSLGLVYREEGKFTEGEAVLTKALALEPEVPGVVNLDRAAALNNLAAAYFSEGRYAEAEAALRQALAIRQKGLGPDDPGVAQYLRNLAALYNKQSKFRDAEGLLSQALQIDRAKLGPDSTAVAHDENTLGAVYYGEHRYAEAEPLLTHALEINERALGDEHPDVATNLSNLGTLYSDEKRNAEAEPLLKRALEIREKVFGPDHPDVATTLGNLAGVYYEEKKYPACEELMKRALAIDEKVNGPEHPEVATDLGNIGAVYEAENKFPEAEAAYLRALQIEKKVQQREYPNVAIATKRLASFYSQRGDFAKAEPLFRQVLAIVEKALGPDHTNVAASLDNLATVLFRLNHNEEARADEERAATIRANAAKQP